MFFFLLLLFAAACSPTGEGVATPTSRPTTALKHYATATATASISPLDLITPSPLPTLTPTPRTHLVKRGEDLGGIAFRYGITLSALMEANPEVDPYILSVGTTLVIPAPVESVEPENLPSPTPVAVVLETAHCERQFDGGMWCFLLAHNPQEIPVENVSALIQIFGEGQQFNKIAISPLNLIPAGGELPLAAYFTPPLPETFQAIASPLTALPVIVNDQRYLPVEVGELHTQISPGGFIVDVGGKVVFPEGESFAGKVWVAIAALDESGHVVGLRRWEGSGDSAADSQIAFQVRLYSTGASIASVSAWAEARP